MDEHEISANKELEKNTNFESSNADELSHTSLQVEYAAEKSSRCEPVLPECPTVKSSVESACFSKNTQFCSSDGALMHSRVKAKSLIVNDQQTAYEVESGRQNALKTMPVVHNDAVDVPESMIDSCEAHCKMEIMHSESTTTNVGVSIVKPPADQNNDVSMAEIGARAATPKRSVPRKVILGRICTLRTISEKEYRVTPVEVNILADNKCSPNRLLALLTDEPVTFVKQRFMQPNVARRRKIEETTKKEQMEAAPLEPRRRRQSAVMENRTIDDIVSGKRNKARKHEADSVKVPIRKNRVKVPNNDGAWNTTGHWWDGNVLEPPVVPPPGCSEKGHITPPILSHLLLKSRRPRKLKETDNSVSATEPKKRNRSDFSQLSAAFLMTQQTRFSPGMYPQSRPIRQPPPSSLTATFSNNPNFFVGANMALPSQNDNMSSDPRRTDQLLSQQELHKQAAQFWLRFQQQPPLYAQQLIHQAQLRQQNQFMQQHPTHNFQPLQQNYNSPHMQQSSLTHQGFSQQQLQHGLTHQQLQHGMNQQMQHGVNQHMQHGIAQQQLQQHGFTQQQQQHGLTQQQQQYGLTQHQQQQHGLTQHQQQHYNGLNHKQLQHGHTQQQPQHGLTQQQLQQNLTSIHANHGVRQQCANVQHLEQSQQVQLSQQHIQSTQQQQQSHILQQQLEQNSPTPQQLQQQRQGLSTQLQLLQGLTTQQQSQATQIQQLATQQPIHGQTAQQQMHAGATSLQHQLQIQATECGQAEILLQCKTPQLHPSSK
eukprot:GHVL01033362.1.p1 GENE.GHVL01033362.1~~GHVL01033362.1.p1  ORF type:complete len:766 (-),score=142.25 GHVL01033362.1:4160-6457(-)